MLTLPLRKELFWDVDPEILDADKHARLVVERVFSYGTTEEINTVLTRYGREKVRELIVRAGTLDKKTLSFAAWYFNIPKEKFRCYRKMQSNNRRWN